MHEKMAQSSKEIINLLGNIIATITRRYDSLVGIYKVCDKMVVNKTK